MTEGPDRVHELVASGREFDRDAGGRDQADPRGRPPPRPHRRTPAVTPPRAEISRALIAALHRVVDDPGIEVVEHALVVDLLHRRTTARSAG